MLSIDIIEISGGLSCLNEQGIHSINIAREYGNGHLSAVTALQRDIFLVAQNFILYGDEQIHVNIGESVDLPYIGFSICLSGVSSLFYNNHKISMEDSFANIVMSGYKECSGMEIKSNTPVQTFDICMRTSVFEELTGRSINQLMANLKHIDWRADKKFCPKRSKALNIAQRICGQQIFAAWLENPGDMLFLEAKSLEFIALQLRQVDFLMGNLPQKTYKEPYSKQILFASEILKNEMNSPPTILKLSHRVGLNHNKLTHGFRQLFGQTPFEYLRTIRLEKAHTLLTNGKRNVSQAAFEVGYSSLSHFSRNFYREFGETPKALQKEKGVPRN